GISNQSKGIKPSKVCEEEPKSCTAVIKQFENDEVDHAKSGKVDIFGSTHLSLADHDETRGMHATTEFNKGSTHHECEVELKADAVAEGTGTPDTVSVNDQPVAHLSTNINAKLELMIKDSSGSDLASRQTSKGRTTTTSIAPLSSSIAINHSSLGLSSTMKRKSINSSVLCCDCASIGLFEWTNVNGRFSEGMPNVHVRVIVKLTCTNKGLSSFKLLFECHYRWCKLLCAYSWLVRYAVCLLVIYIPRYNDMGVLPFSVADIDDRGRSANGLCDDFPT
ncbi:unnamed protein product, partial [Trichobilharzia regenti]